MDAAGRSILEMPIAANYGNYIRQKNRAMKLQIAILKNKNIKQ